MTSKLLAQAIASGTLSGNSTDVVMSSNGAIELAGNNTTDIFIAANNNVGIGNNTPADALSVQGSLYTSSNTVTLGTGTYFTASGNVGIGVSSPSSKLDIYISSAAVNGIKINNPNTSSAAAAALLTYSDVNSCEWGCYSNASGLSGDAYISVNGSGKNLRIYTGGSERVRVSSSGNMIIGSGGEYGKLNVFSGSTGNTLVGYFGSSDTNYTALSVRNYPSAHKTMLSSEWNTISTSLAFGLGGNEYMRLHDNGCVGIGTQTPTAKLQFESIIEDNKINFYRSTGDVYGIGVRSSQLMVYSGAGGTSEGGVTFGKFDGSTFTEHMRVRNDGIILTPNRPAFHATDGYSGSLLTSGTTVIFSTAVRNTGNYYNTSNGRFTAPVSGWYHFDFQVLNYPTTTVNSGTYLSINGTGSYILLNRYYNAPTQTTQHSAGNIYLSAGDYVCIRTDADTYVYNLSGHGFFTGYLIG